MIAWREAARCTASSTMKQPRSSRSSTNGQRSTGRIASSHTRGSYRGRILVSPASVRRVLAAHGLVLRAPKRKGTSTKTPWPDWCTYRPNEMWIYDTTHFSATKGISVSVVEDMISRKWIDTIVSAEETSTQIQVLFTNALEREGLLEHVEARLDRSISPSMTTNGRSCWLCRTTARR
jgi:hypothetical protein